MSTPLAWPRTRWRSALARAGRLFEQRSLRERLMITAALAALLWLAAEPLWVQAGWQRWQRSQARVAAAQARLDQALAEAARIGARQQQQQQELAAEWRQLQARVERGDFEPAHQGDVLVSAAGMLPLLERLLAPHAGLRVRAVQSLGSTPADGTPGATSSSAVAAASSTGTMATPHGGTVWRHGLELQLEGPYAELLAYLQALEQAPQKVLWGRLQLQVRQHPQVLLTLRLYTLSLDAGWVEIRS